MVASKAKRERDLQALKKRSSQRRRSYTSLNKIIRMYISHGYFTFYETAGSAAASPMGDRKFYEAFPPSLQQQPRGQQQQQQQLMERQQKDPMSQLQQPQRQKNVTF